MSRPYEQFERPELKQVAIENWDNPYPLKEIYSELNLHRTKRKPVLNLMFLIKGRLEELESDCFRFPSTNLTGNSGEMKIIDRQQTGLTLCAT